MDIHCLYILQFIAQYSCTYKGGPKEDWRGIQKKSFISDFKEKKSFPHKALRDFHVYLQGTTRQCPLLFQRQSEAATAGRAWLGDSYGQAGASLA